MQQQPEASLGDSIFDWGAMSSQPSLVADGGSSPAHTDLFADELDLLDQRAESDSMFGKSSTERDDGVFDMMEGNVEDWILGQ